MLKIAVCDDEKLFRKNIKELVSGYLNQDAVEYEIDTYCSGEEFLKLGIEMVKYQIAFLDINMAQIDGIMTAKKIREVSSEIYIVFVTAFVNYTLEGYKVDAVRYLLKSNTNFKESVYECMDAIIRKMNYVIVKKEFRFQEGTKVVPLNRLLYIESVLHKLKFYVMEDKLKVYTLYETLNNMEQQFQGNGFVRVHQSFLVNMKHMKSVSGYEVLLSNGTRLAVPKARYKYVKETFIAYKGEI